jgi:hypothetical protein
MHFDESHLTDQELLLAADGELPPARREHLASCWVCRARKQDTEATIVDFVQFHHARLNPLIPPIAASRAVLKARLATLASAPQPWWRQNLQFLIQSAVVLALVSIAVGAYYSWPGSLNSLAHLGPVRIVPVSIPEPSLTPGAVVTADREQVCRTAQPKNRAVPVSLQRRVFEEYGIAGAQPQAYEVDYLITPALGGADDIRNLWPQSNSSAVWNAHVKDALEDRLREMVCAGTVDLAAAQHDLSSDWIAAYKRYFHTDYPLEPDR